MMETKDTSDNIGTTPQLVDDRVAALIAVGAAMAANSEPCFTRAVAASKAAGADEDGIRGAVRIGQMVKDKPAGVLKAAADALTGTRLAIPAGDGTCPTQAMGSGVEFNLTMLIASGAAMAAGCEPCLNKSVPALIEAGVADEDIRRATEIGQAARDCSASIMMEAAKARAGAEFEDARPAGDCSDDVSQPVSACCG